jgi:hypothetical protein
MVVNGRFRQSPLKHQRRLRAFRFRPALRHAAGKNGSRCRVPTDQGLVDVRSQQSDIFLARPAFADSVNCAVFNDFVTTDNVVTGSRLIDCIPPPSISD